MDIHILLVWVYILLVRGLHVYDETSLFVEWLASLIQCLWYCYTQEGFLLGVAVKFYTQEGFLLGVAVKQSCCYGALDNQNIARYLKVLQGYCRESMSLIVIIKYLRSMQKKRNFF